jgi:hypothetical protein
MATSKVAIANGALQRLGAGRIESLTQDHPNARSMNAAFDRVVRAEIRKYGWNFAIKRASIAADGDLSEWGEWKRYSLPNDYLRILRDDESKLNVDWRLEGLYILSGDASPLQFRYLAHIEDPNYYDSLFIETVECKLAAVTCKEITGSNEAKRLAFEEHAIAIAEAKRVNALEKEAQEFPEDDWVQARL